MKLENTINVLRPQVGSKHQTRLPPAPVRFCKPSPHPTPICRTGSGKHNQAGLPGAETQLLWCINLRILHQLTRGALRRRVVTDIPLFRGC